MVNVRVRVRPLPAYHRPNKVDHLEIDSYERLETIQEKYSTTGSTTRLYYEGHELPLNSSIGSHNFQDDAILECCRSPAISAALSACLKDLDDVKKLDAAERTRHNLLRILQLPLHIASNPTHDIWQASSWTEDSLKSRIINFATMKAVLQRTDRYQAHDLPQCTDCKSLFDALKQHNVWNGGNRGGRTNGRNNFNSQSHIFKPEKKDGNPSTNWLLLNEKLRIQQRIRMEYSRGFGALDDYIEEFVKRDHERHENKNPRGQSVRSSTACSPVRSKSLLDDSESYLQHLAATPPPPSERQTQGGAPFDLGATISSPRRTPPNNNSNSNNKYIPQYASGPFSVLATLYNAMKAKHPLAMGQRLLTLSEDQLKRMAQPRCRANLYDKMRIRGRNAFACMDGLIEKQLVRKEIVRDTINGGEIEKWGLLREGEILGGFCAEFERAVGDAMPVKEMFEHSATASARLVLCIDSREDDLFRQRMKWSCEDENIPFAEKDLPAGDYIFLNELQNKLVPVVFERKSWSDLADSCLGKGRALNRLDCVKLNSNGLVTSCQGNCQLCKMKRSGCKQIVFIIEGARCERKVGARRTPKLCTTHDCCGICKELKERHNVTQDALEGLLTRLQVEHGCYIHYTRSFNDTVQSLFTIRTLLQSRPCFASRLLRESSSLDGLLAFSEYASNARSRQGTISSKLLPLETVHEREVESLASVIGVGRWDTDLAQQMIGLYPLLAGKSSSNQPRQRRGLPKETLLLDSDSDEEVKEVFPTKSNPETICIDTDSENESGKTGKQRVSQGGAKTSYNSDVEVVDARNKSDDSIIVLDDEPVFLKKQNVHQPNVDYTKKLIILREWDHYDQKVSKSLEKMWRQLYSCDCQLGSFYRASSSLLEGTIASSALPHLNRRTLMSFTLFMQLALGVHIRSVQSDVVTSDIKTLLRQNGSTTASKPPSQSCTRTPAKTARPSINTSNTAPKPPRESSASLHGGSAMSVDRPRLSSMNSERDAAREARLRRFDSTSSCSIILPVNLQMGQSKQSAGWTCPCTLINTPSSSLCESCGSSRPGSKQSSSSYYRRPPPQPRRPISSNDALLAEWKCPLCGLANPPRDEACDVCATPRPGYQALLVSASASSAKKWSCSHCTLENEEGTDECSACGNANERPTKYARKAPPGETETESTPKRVARCGACGVEGHTRANATVQNCVAYNDDIEVDRREKQRLKKDQAIVAERDRIQRLEREAADQEKSHQEWLEKTKTLEKGFAQANEYRELELKRAKKKMERLQKRKR
mmetsp:Transcript_20241/g.43656  ORF Transcript_20241/g.43656 Transcript_20241/m.43656 type:complete len:1278 (+) Transcript_20241:108-3941(+)